jgi:paired amphipathic helix protein Sin3a
MAHAPSGPNGSTNALGGPGGPGAMFGGPLQQENGRGMPQDGARAMQQLPFGSSMGPAHAVPSGPGGMPQGQQPILNVCCMWLGEAGPAMGFAANLFPFRMR